MGYECPHCKYRNGWIHDLRDLFDGEEGDFYKFETKASRTIGNTTESKMILVCPRCNNLFAEDD